MDPFDVAWVLVKQDDRQYGEHLLDYQMRVYGGACKFCDSGKGAMHNAVFPEPRCRECVERAVEELFPSMEELQTQLNQGAAEGRNPRYQIAQPTPPTVQTADTGFPSHFSEDMKSEPFDAAWSILKAGVIRPVGRQSGRNVVLIGGVPYYQSSKGTSGKAAGAFYPFAGIEPDSSTHEGLPSTEYKTPWWMKGEEYHMGGDNPEHAMDWRRNIGQTTPAGQRATALSDHIDSAITRIMAEQYPQGMSVRQMNMALEEAGSPPIPIRGEYDTVLAD